ncbi:MAG: hypothetical protein PHW24_05030 [Candidatus Moranbacteria bacterium]|nr:hypothetical protein [Candidatus Moranbacteria bacterium]
MLAESLAIIFITMSVFAFADFVRARINGCSVAELLDRRSGPTGNPNMGRRVTDHE